MLDATGAVGFLEASFGDPVAEVLASAAAGPCDLLLASSVGAFGDVACGSSEF